MTNLTSYLNLQQDTLQNWPTDKPMNVSIEEVKERINKHTQKIDRNSQDLKRLFSSLQ